MNYKKSMHNRGAAYKDPRIETTSRHWISEHGVSLHAIKRWYERVWGADQNMHIPDEDLIRIAKIIVGCIEVTIDKTTNATVPLIDGFVAIIRNGLVTTIKDK